MKYNLLLKKAILESGMSLNEICNRLELHGFKTSKSHLSKLQNGVLPPGSDKLNIALANVLEIDSLELRTAAYREKIPKDVLEKLSQKIS